MECGGGRQEKKLKLSASDFSEDCGEITRETDSECASTGVGYLRGKNYL